MLSDAPLVSAQEVTVPVELQVSLLGRVVLYDRGFRNRVGGRATVLVVSRRDSVSSLRASRQLTTALRRAGNLGSVPIEVRETTFTSANALAAEVVSSGASIVYLSAALGDVAAAVAAALSGKQVLTVSAVSADVEVGIVLGFELVESRPRIVVHLSRARSHGIEFTSTLLRIARIAS